MNELKRMSYAGCVTLFKTRQSHAARFSFMPVVLKSPGLKPIEAQNARSRSARVPYTVSQATGAAWYSSWACFESGRINQSVRTAASQVMRSARRRLPARKPNAMAIPQQTIKILGTPVLGEDHAFDWHAKSFYIKADGGHHPPFAQTNGAGIRSQQDSSSPEATEAALRCRHTWHVSCWHSADLTVWSNVRFAP